MLWPQMFSRSKPFLTWAPRQLLQILCLPRRQPRAELLLLLPAPVLLTLIGLLQFALPAERKQEPSPPHLRTIASAEIRFEPNLRPSVVSSASSALQWQASDLSGLTDGMMLKMHALLLEADGDCHQKTN